MIIPHYLITNQSEEYPWLDYTPHNPHFLTLSWKSFSIWKWIDTCIGITASLCCIPETQHCNQLYSYIKGLKKKPKVFSWNASGSSGFLSTSCLDSLVRCPANKHRSFLHHNSGISRLALLHAANGPKLLSVHTTLHLGHFSSPNEGGGDRFPTASNPLGH